MHWLERAAFTAIGGCLTAVGFWYAGRVNLGDHEAEFAANATGAFIGGFISVGLALFMFHHERSEANRTADQTARLQRTNAIMDALRYVRSVRDAVASARPLTINNKTRVVRSINQAVMLTERALGDINLTDVDLRLTMEDAAKIGHEVAQNFNFIVDSCGLDDADQHVLGADGPRDAALSKLDVLKDDYFSRRQNRYA
jgi:hypothetical protein